jgi:hypothetical protein
MSHFTQPNYDGLPHPQWGQRSEEELRADRLRQKITGWADPWLDDNGPSERSHHPYDPDHLPEGYTELTDEERQRRLDMLRTIFPKQD